MIYVTSDLHFNHGKSFIYEPRGFYNIREHDRSIIYNWNNVVKTEDEVYLLGDIGLGSDPEYIYDCMKKLNGLIHWVYGNHDTKNRIEVVRQLPHVVCEGYAIVLKNRKQRFWLSHYPTQTAPIGYKPFYNSLISLCGHAHTQDRWADWNTHMIYHVELDAHDNRPVSLEEILNDIRARMA